MNKLYLCLFCYVLFCSGYAYSQCNINQQSIPQILSITSVPATCPSNGSITVNVNPATGGGIFVYEVTSGPVLRLIQSQNTLYSLPAGDYNVRVTGCNGKIKDTLVNVANHYTSIQQISFAEKSSEAMFRCGNIDGKIFIQIKSFIGDTSNIRWPIQYQITTSPDPINGFVNIPYNTIQKLQNPYQDPETWMHIVMAKDSITNLNIGTYLIRFTDACNNMFVRSVTLDPPTPYVAYEFDFKYTNYTYMDTMYNGTHCKHWWYVNFIDSSSSDIVDNNIYHSEENINGPWTITIRNGITNTIVHQLLKYKTDTLFGFSPFVNQQHLLDYDIPYIFEVTNSCGYTKTYSLPAKTRNIPQAQIDKYCNTDGFYLNTYETHGSVIFKQIHVATYTTTQIDTLVSWSKHYTGVPLNELYRYIVHDGCGFVDSLEYSDTIYTDNGMYTLPVWNDTSFYNPITCGDNTMNLRLQLQQGNIWWGGWVQPYEFDKRPLFHPNTNWWGRDSACYLLSGPANSGPYPRYLDIYAWMPDDPGPNWDIFGADSMEAGNYQVVIRYGCNKWDTTTIQLLQAAPTPYSIDHIYSVNYTPCFGVNLQKSVSTIGINPKSTPVIQTGPPAFLSQIQQQFSYWANFASMLGYNVLNMQYPTTYPVAFPNTRVPHFYNNHFKLDTPFSLIILDPITLETFDIVQNGELITFSDVFENNQKLPPGSYQIDWITKDFCNNMIVESDNFVMPEFQNEELTLGSSSAYACQNNNVNIYCFPLGGKKPYLYQIKHKDSINTDFSPLQLDSVFALPNNTPIGTTYYLRVIDSCGTATTGEVTVSNFDGEFYLPKLVVCELASADLKTSFIPYSTYTWSGPNPPYSSDSNVLHLPSVSIADTGFYNLQIDVLNGCYNKSAQGGINTIVCFPLPNHSISLSAYLENNTIAKLQWNYEVNNAAEIFLEKSDDGIIFYEIARMKPEDNTMQYDDKQLLHNTYYYRIKITTHDNEVLYSNVANIRRSILSEVKVFPNPNTTGRLHFIFNGQNNNTALISIYNLNGSKVLSDVLNIVNNNTDINIKNLPLGTYHYRIQIDDNNYSGTFQKR